MIFEKKNEIDYDLGSYKFETSHFFPKNIFYKITEVRLNKINEILTEQYENRVKRKYPWNSNLVIIAADHPARRVTYVGANELAMGDRQEYLGRIIRVLMLDQVDGVMATPDILDDLLIINYLLKENGGKSYIDNKILLGCTNRGGLLGSVYEMYDPITAYSIEDVKRLGLDGAKMMVRLDLETEMAKYSQKTLEICSKMIRQCNKYNIPAFIEPLPVKRSSNGSYKIKMSADEIIKTIGIAIALGGDSHNIWLKIPYVDNYESVAKSASNPILILGGESTGNPLDILKDFENGLKAGKNVKGCLAGRNILFPGQDDPRAIALAISKIIHDYASIEDAVKIITQNRGKEMDFLTSKII